MKGIQYGVVNWHEYANVKGMAQEAYIASNKDPKIIAQLSCTYDADTGVLIDSNFLYLPMTIDFNFKIKVDGFGYLIDTNIDLGPYDISQTILYNLPQIIVYGLFITGALILIIKIIRKRRESP